ncbi:Eco57I restriction-modification methylase domain-containing protein [Arthrobacter antibioticus]|uniref:Eco57I restriction-modification methylase domain-containing protein n=1 Tax=Arthrobacter sp. H35-MC1 TaxID=3046203 RepID=UPI0024B8ABF6|nr:N-6 DNA methylase [Arthrobacter sp. H35-MC1]MDJ0318596.1 N-6 DNA methylase [Arthrobacter sp. H35-MC1]
MAADRKRHGKHYTPENLAFFLASRIAGHLPDQPSSLSILDPACGDGELLFAAHEVLSAKYPGVTIALHGYDLDGTAISVAHSRAMAKGITIQLQEADFLVASDTIFHAYDAIITNPPYVRTQQLGAETAKLLADKFGLTGRIDLTHPFVSVSPRILNSTGVLGILCSNRFLTTKAGSNVRAIMGDTLSPVEVYDLGDSKLFEAAVLPAITIAVKKQPRIERECSYTSTYESPSREVIAGEYFDVLSERSSGFARIEDRTFEVRSGTLVHGKTPSEPWTMGNTAEDEWFKGITVRTWKTFGEVAKIRVGIKTTADAVFIRDEWDKLEEGLQPEEDLLRPLITHHNVPAWKFDRTKTTSVLYPYDLSVPKRTLVDMTKYPKAMAYLEENHERLSGRKYVIEGGRQWYEIWVPQKPSLWMIPKIVFPDISEEPRFALDRTGAVVNGDCYWMSLDDIKDEDLALLMIGIANSSLATRFYDHACGNKLYSGRRRWITQYVSKFPIPSPDSAHARRIVEFASKFATSDLPPNATELAELDAEVYAAFAVTRQVELASETLF